MSITIKEAISEADREKVYRLRYEIYVQEMGRMQNYADPRSQTIKEPVDETGHLLLAEDHNDPVGTVRTNLRREGPLEYEELYDLQQLRPFYPGRDIDDHEVDGEEISSEFPSSRSTGRRQLSIQPGEWNQG